MLNRDELGPLAHYFNDWQAEPVTPGAMPETARRLLVHEGDMTSRLAEFHGAGIGLTAHAMERGEDVLFRLSVLRRMDTGAAVEFGAIRIDLGGFAAGPRRQIETGEMPLGGVLVSNAIPFTSHPRGYFRIAANAELVRFLGVAEGVVLYGRANELRHAGGRPIAEVVEILPAVSG